MGGNGDAIDEFMRTNLVAHASGRLAHYIGTCSNDLLIEHLRRASDGVLECVAVDRFNSYAEGVGLDVSLAWQTLCNRCGGENEARELVFQSNTFLNTENQIVAHNARLDTVYVCDAVLKGAWIDSGENAKVCYCYSKRASDELSMQIQARYRDCLKCVHVVLQQVGDDVVARADWAAYTSSDRNIGYDFASEYSWCHDDHRVPVGPDGYGIVRFRVAKLPVLEQRTMPCVVYKDGQMRNDHASGAMGNVGAMKVNEAFYESDSSCACMRVEYGVGDDWAGLLWQNPEWDWGERPGGSNLTNANTLFFRARGEFGGEKVKFFMGGLADKMVSDTANRSLDVTLTKEWRLYKITLEDLDLSRVKSSFGFSFQGQGHPFVFYLNNIFYDSVSDSRYYGVSVNALPSLLERKDAGDSDAMYELGVRAENGTDYAPCVSTAKKWYLKAARVGNEWAADALERLLDVR